jgi:4-amino-4-deoxy-L-arabinose transferase-like glycosyltransferase
MALAALLLVLTGYRFLALASADLQLYFDEAYYWGWSRDLAFGYYSKPPMIAWTIRAMTSVCGETELCIRSGTLILFTGATVVLFGIGTRLFGPRVGFLTALTFVSLPVVSFYSWLMTTDVLLLFFWALALYGLIRALQRDRLGDWLLTGTAIGLGLLSKYTMLVFLASAALYFAWAPQHRFHLTRPKIWMALGLGLVIFLPNLLWNLNSGFASFKHTAEVAHWGQDLFHPDRLLEFWGVQLLLFGPLLSFALIFYAVRLRALFLVDDRYRLLLCFAVPLLAMYSVQALLARANFNWAAASYVAAAVMAAACLAQIGRYRLLIGAVSVNLILGSALYHYGWMAGQVGIELTRKTDLYAWMKGWRELGQTLRTILDGFPEAGLASDNRRLLAELTYYIRPHPLETVVWNPSGRISDHYRLTADLRHTQREGFIFVTEEQSSDFLNSSFATVKDLGPIKIQLYRDDAREYRVYFVHHFLGYPS